MAYDSLVLIPSGCEIALADAATAIRQRLAEFEFSETDNTLSVSTSDGWTISVGFSSGAHVADEAKEIVADAGADLPNPDALTNGTARFEIGGDDDPGMDHFNDYCLVVEALESLGPVAVFDLGTGEFL